MPAEVQVPNPVPPLSVPKHVRAKVYAKCGPTGWIVEVEYDPQEGQKFTWPLYMQSGFAASIAIINSDPSGQEFVSLTRQWRPGDRDGCIELPAGNIGLGDPTKIFARTLKSVLAEVGEIDIERAWIGRGVAHDVGREISGRVLSMDETGEAEIEISGFKLFIPCVFSVRSHVETMVHHGEGDEKTHTAMYKISDAIRMMNEGAIYDAVTSLFLPPAIRLVRGTSDEWDQRFHWEEVPTALVEECMSQAREILATLGK